MENNKTLSALEARKISEQNQTSLSDAMKIIENASKNGNVMVLFTNLHQDALERLLRLDYKISKFTDSVGLYVTRVEW